MRIVINQGNLSVIFFFLNEPSSSDRGRYLSWDFAADQVLHGMLSKYSFLYRAPAGRGMRVVPGERWLGGNWDSSMWPITHTKQCGP